MSDILSFTLYKDVTVYDLLVFVAVVFLSVIIARIVRSNVRRVLRSKVDSDVLSVVEKLVYYTIIVAGLVSVLPQVGVDLTGLLVAGGVVGLVIGFASQSVVANLISGLFLVFERPVKIGEQIQVGDVSGTVVDVRILSTTIKTYDGEYVRVPNETMFSSEITNFIANKARRLEYTVGIDYSDDPQKARKVITETVEAHPFVLVDPPPNIFVDELADSSINIMVRVWTPSQMWYAVRTELLQEIKGTLEKEGIHIPFPQRVVHFVGDVHRKEISESPPEFNLDSIAGLNRVSVSSKPKPEPEPESESEPEPESEPETPSDPGPEFEK